MRWFVEMNPAAGGEGARATVEADGWQGALDAACARLGVPVPMRPAKEEHGARVSVVDLATGARFELVRADSISPMGPPSWLVPTRLDVPTDEAPTIVEVPPIAGPPISLNVPAVSTLVRDPPSTPRTAGPPRRGIAHAPPSDVASTEPASGPRSTTLVSPAPPESVASTLVSPAPDAGYRATRQSPGSPPPRADLFLAQEELPDARRAFTTRRKAWVVPPGTADDVTARMLLAEFARAGAALASEPPGQMLVLEVYDHRFAGAPARPPLARLVFRDWKGPVPEIRVGAAVVTGLGPDEPPIDPGGHARGAPAEIGLDTTQALRPPASPVDALSAAIGDARTAHEIAHAASIAIAALTEKVQAEVALLHVRVPRASELVVVHALGGAPLVGARTPLSDALIADAVVAVRAVVVPEVGRDDRVGGARWARLGVALRAVACAPATSGGRLLGAIELGRTTRRFDEREAAQLAHVAERFGAWLAARLPGG